MLLKFKPKYKNIENISEIIKELQFEKMIVICNSKNVANFYSEELSYLTKWKLRKDIDRVFLYKDNKQAIFYFNENVDIVRGMRAEVVCLFGKFKKDFVQSVCLGLCTRKK